MENNEIITGKTRYKDIDFTFVFDGFELRLIPPEDKEHTIGWDWKMKEIEKGRYTFAEPMHIEEPYLVGECNEKYHRIVFLPEVGSYIATRNYIVIIQIKGYIVFTSDQRISKMSVSCPELNYIYPTNQLVTYELNTEGFSSNGVIGITTKDFDSTKTDKTEFVVDDRKIEVYFSINRTVSSKNNRAPIVAESVLIFTFEQTDDYDFLYQLWTIAQNFIRFLCYRKDVYIPSVMLSAIQDNDKYQECATLYVCNQDEPSDLEILEKGRYIKQIYISGYEGKILSDIANYRLYMRHIPESYDAGREIDAARFVMITAAFEWEFKRAYPKGITKSSRTTEAENQVDKEISNCIEHSKGKKKEIYKFLKKLIRSNSLASEITQIGKDYANIVNIFGIQKYSWNHQKLDYTKMGERLSKQRNNFAHGNLEQDFIGNSLLDLIFLENVIYAIQLKQYGIDDICIQKAINDLFGCHIAIKEHTD